MNKRLKIRLNQIGSRIVSDEFLEGRGLGNDLAFHIFDYPPEEELTIREHVQVLVDSLPKQCPSLRLCHINLFKVIMDYLKERKLLDRALQLQRGKGNAAFQNALKGPLHEEKVAKALVNVAQPGKHDVVFLTGVGTAWPLIRTHTLLNALQPVMGKTPLVVFYPGKYDGQGVQLFGLLDNSNYYRAFQLVS